MAKIAQTGQYVVSFRIHVTIYLMKIILKPHLKLRLKARQIPISYPEKILSKPDNRYFDTLTQHLIAVKTLEYAGKLRLMIVAYDIIKDTTEVITIYPADNQEINNRIKNKRWVKYEKG